MKFEAVIHLHLGAVALLHSAEPLTGFPSVPCFTGQRPTDSTVTSPPITRMCRTDTTEYLVC